MSNEIVGLVGIAVLLVLLQFRVSIALSLILVSFVGIWTVVGERPAWGIISAVPYEFVAQWTLTAVPMFLLMGYVCYHAGLTKGIFDVCRVWLSRLPGGLAVASIFASGAFSSVTGSSVACAAAMGRIAVPEMISRRYDPALATGTIAAAGTLGALIPPSILLMLFGIMAEVPINLLFIGGLAAGLMTLVSYILVVVIRAWINPALAPRTDESMALRDKLLLLWQAWPILLIIVVVHGGLGVGLFTATEAGAVGAMIAFLFAFAKGSLNREVFWKSIMDTISTTGSIFIITVGASLLARFLALSGTADLITGSIIGLGSDPWMLILGAIVLYLVLGTFLEPLGTMVLTLPILLPIFIAADINLLWFGVVLAKLLEIGMVTPPVGLNVFVIKSVVGNLASLTTIYRGIVWFLVADMVVVAIMVFWPDTITYLPSLITH
ncbi:MAG: TRAP transporter large permease [Rhizobiaceae bacterium]|nr:TRAP transporter large permease [Rhizobiaceae bacterium]